MKQKYYLDTCIWRDYYENRTDRFRPLGEWALMLLNNILKNKDFVLYSEFVVEELNVKYTEEEIKRIFEVMKELILKVRVSQHQRHEAAKLARKRNIHAEDALHGILARDNNAIMVTRDYHFEELRDIVNVKKPEDLI